MSEWNLYKRSLHQRAYWDEHILFGPKQRVNVTGYAIHLNTILCTEIFYILHVFLFYLPSFLLAKFKPDLLPTLMVSHMFVKEKNCRVTSLTLLIGWNKLNNSVYSIVFTVLCFNDIHWQCWLHWYRYNMYLQLQFTAFTSQLAWYTAIMVHNDYGI